MNNGQNALKCPNSGWRFYKRLKTPYKAQNCKYPFPKPRFWQEIGPFVQTTSYLYIVTFPDEEVAEESLTSLISSEKPRPPVPRPPYITNTKSTKFQI